MPGTQPAWYMGTGVFLTLGVRTGCKVWGSRQHRGRDRTGGCGRAAYLLILPFPQLSERGW